MHHSSDADFSLKSSPERVVQRILNAFPPASSAMHSRQTLLACGRHIFGEQACADSVFLKRAYKRLVMSVHPDKNSSSAAAEAFQLLHASFEATLEDIREREEEMNRSAACSSLLSPLPPPPNVFDGQPAAPNVFAQPTQHHGDFSSSLSSSSSPSSSRSVPTAFSFYAEQHSEAILRGSTGGLPPPCVLNASVSDSQVAQDALAERCNVNATQNWHTHINTGDAVEAGKSSSMRRHGCSTRTGEMPKNDFCACGKARKGTCFLCE